MIRLTDKYQPTFYILPKDGTAGDDIFHILSQQHKIRVEWQNKLTDIFDQDGIYPESYYYKTSLNRLQRDPRVAQLFSTDLTHIQNYLFTQLKIEPTCKVQVQYDITLRLISLTKLDEFSVERPSI